MTRRCQYRKGGKREKIGGTQISRGEGGEGIDRLKRSLKGDRAEAEAASALPTDSEKGGRTTS